jgi:hypothetical protein
MAFVRMVQVAVHQVVHVVPVGHRFVPAAGSVPVPRFVPAARVLRGAHQRVLLRHLDDVLIHVIPVRGVKMPAMQIIHVVAVLDRRVAASFAVHVRVFSMDLVALFRHEIPSFRIGRGVPDKLEC